MMQSTWSNVIRMRLYSWYFNQGCRAMDTVGSLFYNSIMKIILTSTQKQYIKSHYRFESAQRIGDRFGFSREVVRKYIREAGLVLTAEDIFNIRSNSISTATLKEDNFITKHYLTMPSKQIADKLGRSDVFVRTRINVLGLVIPHHIIEQRKADSRIKPGSVPPNKGKKMSVAQYRKARPTMFRAGHQPANTLFNGAITIRKDKRGVPQKYIRIKKGKWEYLSRYNYRKKVGRIPKGMLVTFINGNTLDCEPPNLMLMSKADNARRNADSQYPPEVRELIRLNNKLKKAIHGTKKQNTRSA